MESFTPELIEKARAAESAEALLALAQENGMEDFTAEAAQSYFALFHPATGEVSDEELENVSGGGCYSKGELVVTPYTEACTDGFCCKHCYKREHYIKRGSPVHDCTQYQRARITYGLYNKCGICKYCEYKRGLWLCTNPQKRK